MQPKSTWNKACRNETVKKKLQVKSTGRVAYMRNCSTGMHEQVALLRFHSRRVDAGAYYGAYLQAYYRIQIYCYVRSTFLLWAYQLTSTYLCMANRVLDQRLHWILNGHVTLDMTQAFTMRDGDNFKSA